MSLEKYVARPARRRVLVALLAKMAVVLSGVPADNSLDRCPSWTIKNSINIRHICYNPSAFDISLPSYLAHEYLFSQEQRSSTGPIVWDSKRRYFFFVTWRGDLDADENIVEIYVFDAGKVDESIKLRREQLLERALVRKWNFSSHYSGSLGVRRIRWAENEPVIVLERTEDDTTFLMVLDVEDGASRRVSGEHQNIVRGFASRHFAVYEVSQKQEIPWVDRSNYPLTIPYKICGPTGFEKILHSTEAVQFTITARFENQEPFEISKTSDPALGNVTISPTTQTATVTLNGDHTLDQSVESMIDFQLRKRIPIKEARSLSSVEHISLKSWPWNVRIKESLNEPPVVTVDDGIVSYKLIDEDSLSASRGWIRTQYLEWSEQGGCTVRGGLTLPLGPVPESGFPFVIQMHFGGQDDFLLDDAGVRNGYATQALAAEGMAVLSLDLSNLTGGEKEGDNFISTLDRAIDKLLHLRLVNSTHIGVSGHSRGGYRVLYALTHSGRHRLAAAMAADSTTESFMSYLRKYSKMGAKAVKGTESARGGSFWQNKSKWMDTEFSFNIDRVRTPLILTYNGADASILALASMIRGAFVANDKPLEQVVFPLGEHNLVTPRERAANMALVVDWFAFWLKSQLPSDPDRAARWAILRKQQDEVLKTPLPPKGKWVFQPDPVQPEWHPPAESKKEALKPVPAGAGKD